MAKEECVIQKRHRGKCIMVVIRDTENHILAWTCRKGRAKLSKQHFHTIPKRVNKKRCNIKESSFPFRDRVS